MISNELRWKTSDGTLIGFCDGNFDSYMVKEEQRFRKATSPLDTDYFTDLKVISDEFGNDFVYNEFCFVYEMVSNRINSDCLEKIKEISNKFKDKKYKVERIFDILYYTMTAEELKENSILGKRIKRLGVYKILFENCDISTAANFMRKMSWKEIDEMCKERGF